MPRDSILSCSSKSEVQYITRYLTTVAGHCSIDQYVCQMLPRNFFKIHDCITPRSVFVAWYTVCASSRQCCWDGRYIHQVHKLCHIWRHHVSCLRKKVAQSSPPKRCYRLHQMTLPAVLLSSSPRQQRPPKIDFWLRWLLLSTATTTAQTWLRQTRLHIHLL